MSIRDWHFIDRSGLLERYPRTIAWLVVLVIAHASFYAGRVTAPVPAPQVVTAIDCELNESTTYNREGWRPILAGTRYHMGALTYVGTTEIDLRHGGLICTVWRGSVPTFDVKAALWHWRPRNGRKNA